MTAMPPDWPRQTLLYTEGGVLQFASQQGDEGAIRYARAMIDGALNAMIRLGGSEQAAAFLFAATDRVVAGIKAPTDFPRISAPPQAGPKGP